VSKILLKREASEARSYRGVGPTDTPGLRSRKSSGPEFRRRGSLGERERNVGSLLTHHIAVGLARGARNIRRGFRIDYGNSRVSAKKEG